jgi:hypothetical protein
MEVSWIRALTLSSLLLAGCGDSDGQTGAGGSIVGQLTGPCLDAQCFNGLVCVSSLCMDPGGSGPSSMSGPTGDPTGSSDSATDGQTSTSGPDPVTGGPTSTPATSGPEPTSSTTPAETTTNPGTLTDPDTTTTTVGTNTNTNTDSNTDPSNGTTEAPGCAGTVCEVCTCQNCPFEWEACQMNVGCKAIQDCITASGCQGFVCSRVCGWVVEEHGGALGESGMLSLTVEVCQSDYCPEECP